MPTDYHANPSITQFCAFAGIGRTKVYDEINAGRLCTVRVGRRRLVPRWSAELWAASAWDGEVWATRGLNPFAAVCYMPSEADDAEAS